MGAAGGSVTARIGWRFLVVAALVMVGAHLLDGWAYRNLVLADVYGEDWGRMFRVMGYVPFWLLAGAALVLTDWPLRAGESARAAWVRGSLLIGSAVAAGIVGELLKLLFRRERPGAHEGAYFFRPFSERTFSSSGLAFPSSHSIVAFGAAFMLARLFPRAAPVWYLLAVGCGLTRVLAGAHFVSDVAAAGLAAWLVAAWLWKRWGARVPAALAVALLLGIGGCARAPDDGGPAADPTERLQAYLRLDTTNPPGNESRGVEFFARIFDAAGIAYETAESAPGRGNIWARLDGGPEPALLLLHHMDVVPADPAYWSTDPLSGELRDGYVYGRGAQDTKALGIMHLETFLGLKRAGRPLNRPVVFMATADEEAGGLFGAGWLVENRPAAFEGVGLLLNEGGGGTDLPGRPVFEVEVTQKVPLWLRLIARDQPGHGSLPRPTTAVTRLIAALERLRTHPFVPRAIPAVDTYLRGRAAAGIGPFADRFADPQAAVAETGFVDRVQAENPFLAALLRNTCTVTRLEGSPKINVVPPEARAEVDCRLLPDQDPAVFIDQIRAILDDPAIEIETIMVFSPAVSGTDTGLYRAIERVALAHFPNAVVLPSVQSGFTDSHFTRDLGITSYGFAPFLTSPTDASGVHGNDERITVENLRRGVGLMREIVEAVVY